MPAFTDRLVHAWNAFMNKDPTGIYDTPNLEHRQTEGYSNLVWPEKEGKPRLD